MTAVKICGITRAEDAEVAVVSGASFLGFVLWPGSPRHVTLARVKAITATLPRDVAPVGVFVNPSGDEINRAAEAGVRVAQIHGSAVEWIGRIGDEIRVIRAVHLAGKPGAIEPNWPDGDLLLDAHDARRHGGTGRTIDWSRARLVAESRTVFLAGGLTPRNVGEAIKQVRPFAVDVASGVESRPGIKDHALLRAFIAAAHGSGSEGTHG